MTDSITRDLEAAIETAADLAARGLAAYEALHALIDERAPSAAISLAAMAALQLRDPLAAIHAQARLLDAYGSLRWREGWGDCERAKAEEAAGLRLVSAR
jgi:hypothetical protein